MSNLQPNGFATTVIGAALTYVMGDLSKVAPILLLDTKCTSQKPPAPPTYTVAAYSDGDGPASMGRVAK
jgi:hypothetical protein